MRQLDTTCECRTGAGRQPKPWTGMAWAGAAALLVAALVAARPGLLLISLVSSIALLSTPRGSARAAFAGSAGHALCAAIGAAAGAAPLPAAAGAAAAAGLGLLVAGPLLDHPPAAGTALLSFFAVPAWDAALVRPAVAAALLVAVAFLAFSPGQDTEKRTSAMSTQSTAEASEQRLRRLEDRADIVEAVHRIAWHVDRREWDRLADVFAEQVRLDYSSVDGQPPATIAGAAVAERWQRLLSGLDATQHLTANHVVRFDGGPDEAVCLAAFRSVHRLPNRCGGPAWTVGGHYRYALTRTPDGWRVVGVTLTAEWLDGNLNVMALAEQAHGD